MSTFKQLPLTGNDCDYAKALDEVNGMSDFIEALKTFYKLNEDINPRQLHYLITSESTDEHLMYILDKR